jgi:hypothetical protein
MKNKNRLKQKQIQHLKTYTQQQELLKFAFTCAEEQEMIIDDAIKNIIFIKPD